MDSDRLEGKTKQAEGKAQEEWGELKDKARDAWEDVKERFDEDAADEQAQEREPERT